MQEYLVDLNAKQAAIRAGYSAKTAESQASRLLKDPAVAAAVAAKTQRLVEKLELRAESVLGELKRYAFRDQPGAAEGLEARDALKALELLGKHLKLFTDKVDVAGADGGPLQVVVQTLPPEAAG